MTDRPSPRPKPKTQSQASLTHQLVELVHLANQNGLYDAADLIRRDYLEGE